MATATSLDLDTDLVTVFEHNDIPVTLIAQEKCCGMPRLELGDLEQVARLKDFNVPHLKQAIDAGYDIVAPIPSCVLMFKQELRLMFPDDPDVQQIAKRIFDPFEYLMLRHLRRPAEDRLQDLSGQGELSRAVSSARAEHRTEDP